MVQSTKSTKTTKNSAQRGHARVIINTGLLTLLAIVFGIVTFLGVTYLRNFSNSLASATIVDGPNLCFRGLSASESADSENRVLERAYICSTEPDEAEYQAGETINMTELSDTKDYALFLYGTNNFNAYGMIYCLTIVLFALGSMLTLGSLVGALVYYLHNR